MIRPQEHPALDASSYDAAPRDVAPVLPARALTGAISFALMCALVVLAPIALRVLVMPVAPHDFWWHMAQGRTIVTMGGVPTVDSFSWTRAGQPFFDQSWLAQVTFYVLHGWGGVPLVVFVQTLCVVACYGVVLWMAVRRSHNARLAALILLVGVVPMSLDNWQIRPQTFALPLFAIILLVLTAYRLRWFNALPLLPVVMALWVNMHGGFEQGLALMVLTLLGEALRRRAQPPTSSDTTDKSTPLSWRECRTLALWSALSFVATLFNPRGVSVYYYVHDVLRHPSTQFSGEWGRPTLHEFTGAWFWGAVVLCLALLAWRRPKLPFTDWLIVVPFLLVAMVSGRSMMWFALVALPFLAIALTSPHDAKATPEIPPTRAQSVINGTLVAFVWLPVLLVLPWWKSALGLPPPMGALLDPQTPVAAVKFLNHLPAAQRPRRLYHSEGAGSYLCWALASPKVWIDTRFELYEPQQWRDAIAFKGAHNVDTILRKYRFDAALLEARNAALQHALQKRGWRVTFHDANSVLLQK